MFGFRRTYELANYDAQLRRSHEGVGEGERESEGELCLALADLIN